MNPKLAVALSREHIRWIRKNTDLEFFCFEKPEIIYSFPMKFLVHTNFTFRNELDEFIKAASASGLIEKWRSIAGAQSNHGNNTEGRTNGLLTLEHVYVALGAWVATWSYQFLVLLTENVVYKQVRNSKGKRRRFWKLIEMIIDPDRHFFL